MNEKHTGGNSEKNYICILKFDSFKPDEFSELYTPLRKKMIETIKLDRAKMQSAAVELCYLAAAKMANEGGIFGAKNGENAKKTAFFELKKRFEYAYSRSGSPVLSGAFMSLSHTDGAALAVISLNPVGADIERERRVSERVAKRIMCAEEYADFLQISENEKNARILECWTAKESFLKLTGEGIAAGLNRLRYDTERSQVRREADGKRAFIKRLDIPGFGGEKGDKLYACICMQRQTELELLHFDDPLSAAEFIIG